MPVNYIDKDNRSVFTTMNPKWVMPYMCNVCANTMLKEGSWVCDYPMHENERGGTKTCDAVLCNAHSYRIAEQVPMTDHNGAFVDDVHICPPHYEEWVRNGSKPFWLND